MELHGLTQVLECIEGHGLSTSNLTTDQHKQAHQALWIKSIINHFWWCYTTCNENAKELKEKWLIILYYITDRHKWEDCYIIKK